MPIFSAIPFFRILVPYVLGSLSAIFFSFTWPWQLGAMTFIAALVSLRYQSKSARQLTLFFCDLFLFGFAIQNVQLVKKHPLQEHYASFLNRDTVRLIKVQLSDVPVLKPKSIKCETKVLAIDLFGKEHACSGKLLVYLQKSVLTTSLKAGDFILLKTYLKPAQAAMNPFEFNYKSYLQNKQVFAMAYADSLHVLPIAQSEKSQTLWQFGLNVKTQVLHKLQHSHLSKAAYGICAALLTGYDDDIDRDIITAFAHSGTLHVLSVSGLHTGLIYACLIFLFRFIDRKRKFKLIELLFCTLFLWAFALVTGFSAPVLRAVIMFNLLAFGKLFFRNTNRNQLNILAVSAFCLLFWDPYLMLDVGFLLSYGAMFGLIYFQPALQSLWQSQHKILSAIWVNTSASVSATLSTLPLTLYLFKQFPIWFALCNLLVVPATFVMLLLAFIMLLGWQWLAVPINYLTQFLIQFIALFDHSGLGYFDSIDFGQVDAIFLSVLLIMGSRAIQERKPKLILASVGILCIWQLAAICESYIKKQKSEICVFSLRKSFGIAVKDGPSCSLALKDSSHYAFSIQPYLTNCNYPIVSKREFNVIQQNGSQVVITHQLDSIPNTALEKVSVLIIGGGFRLKPQHLAALPALKLVVIDGTNKPPVVKRTRELCRNFAREYWVLADSGACLLKPELVNYEIENWR